MREGNRIMFNLKGKLYKALLLRKGRVLQNVNEMRSAEFLDPQYVNDLQNKRLEQLLTHAYSHVPYWKSVLREYGVIQGERVHIEELNRVPLLTKEIIREQGINLISDDLETRTWFHNTSGGSTGEPVRLVQDKIFSDWGQAAKILFDLWTGYHLGQNKFILWGSERDIFLGGERFKIRVGRFFKGEKWGNAFKMDATRMQEFVRIINRIKPVQILAYAESIYELAEFIKNQGMAVYQPRAIMTSAGTLYDYMRQSIETVFAAPVFNRYGSREVGDIACECEAHQGLHINPVTHYVEILRDDGTPCASGEIGEVVVTSLTNYVMPLIRYRIGDMAAFSEKKCSCGRGWPLLSQVTGRVVDTFLTRDGVRVNGEYFTHLIYFKDWVKKFQFIQDEYEKVRLCVVPAVSLEEGYRILYKEKEELESKVRLVMGPNCNLEVEVVEDIPPSPSGKYRYTISRLQR